MIAFFLFFRPPTISFIGTSLDQSKSALPIFQPDPSSFAVNLTLKFSVNNPNVIGATLKKIEASGQSPSLPTVDIAKGVIYDVNIDSKGNTTIDFPMTVTYSSRTDPKALALSDMLNRCGLTGKAKQQIPLNYNVVITASILGIGITLPSFTSTAKFDCPLPNGFTNPLIQSVLSLLSPK